MAASWSLGSIPIFVTEISASNKNTIARLQPLAGGTVYQFFGYENAITKIRGYVVGESDLNSITAFATTGSTHTLYGLQNGSTTLFGNYYVGSVSWNRVPAIYQTLTNDCDASLFIVDVELYT